MSYVEVPAEVISSYPTVPAPMGWGGAGISQQAQGGKNSLGNVVGLTDTIVTKYPSDIAFEALKKLHDLPDDDSRKDELKICNELYVYLLNSEDKNFHLKGYNTKTGKMVGAQLDYNNRWSPRYRKQLSRQLDLLENWFKDCDRNLTFISLTGGQRGISRSEHWGKINDSRIKLLKILKKYYPHIQYVWVTEPHMENDTGFAHYHLVAFADVSNNVKDKKTGEGMEDKLRRLWSEKYKTGSHTYGLDFKQPKPGMEVKSLKSYLVKYLRKSTLFGEWTPGLLVYNAIMWSTGHRAFGASKGIREIMKIPKDENKEVVWLETRLTLPSGEEKVMPGYRLYIPEWIDSPFWVDALVDGNDPEKIYTYDWGRRIGSDWENRVYEYREMLRTQKETGINWRKSEW